MLAPIRMAPPEASGINFIVSFGIGCLMLTPVFTIPYYGYKRQLPDFGLKVWGIVFYSSFSDEIRNFFLFFSFNFLDFSPFLFSPLDLATVAWSDLWYTVEYR
jgi:hypothetical protein